MEIVRISTAGSVDDGKSTLIGRLLYDTKSMTQDQVEAIKRASQKRGIEGIDFSLFTDGLTAEREQGITIDVAHIYFNTEKRKYIIADTPGHVEYTRNMITGASNSNISIILIDARKGMSEQTKRHLFITSLLRIKKVYVAINKIDLVDFKEEVYLDIKKDVEAYIHKLDFNDFSLHIFPISALRGDNLVEKSPNTPWYDGDALLPALEKLQVSHERTEPARFNVQVVIRPKNEEFHDFRGFAGKVKSSSFSVGDKVTVLPGNQESEIKEIIHSREPIEKALAEQSVCITLKHEIDISRGDVLVKSNEVIEEKNSFDATLCWMNKTPLVSGKKYLLQHGSTVIPVKVAEVFHQIEPENLDKIENPNVGLNIIAKVHIRSASPVYLDSYEANKYHGAFILIDEQTNETLALGIMS